MYGTAETMAMARVLLERGADPNARTASFKQLKKFAILGLIEFRKT
jgi:hypothetical protein